MGLADADTMGSIGQGAAAGTAIAPGVGTVIGAGLGLVGGILGNETSASNASNANAASEDMFYANLQFQDTMAKNRYQYTVDDLKAAGLNPMLAYTNGPSGPAGGSGIPAIQTPQYRSPIDAASTSAAVAAGLKKTEADTRVADTQSAVNSAAAAKLTTETIGAGYYNANLLQEGAQKHSLTELTNRQVEDLQRQLDARRPEADVGLTRTKQGNIAADTYLQEQGFPRAMKEADFWRSGAGSVAPYINQIGTSAVNSAASLRGMFR